MLYVKSLRIEAIEGLCRAFECTPNELFVYSGGGAVTADDGVVGGYGSGFQRYNVGSSGG